MSFRNTLRWGAVLLGAAIILLGPGANRAEAYIDPGTGSNLLSVLGIILGVVCSTLMVVYFQLRHWGTALLARLRPQRELGSNPEPDEIEMPRSDDSP